MRLPGLSCCLLLTGAALLQRTGFAGEDGFDALQVWDVELAGRVVVIECLNLLSANALNQSLLKCFLSA